MTGTASSERGTDFKKLEHAMRTSTGRDGYVVFRIDGKGFSRWTRQLDKPFDTGFLSAMADATAACATLSGAPVVFAYTQSDEISVVVDNNGDKREPWFGGDVQKSVSVMASVATAAFNDAVRQFHGDLSMAFFDARVALVTPDPEVVADYLAWRWGDAVKNSVSMLAHHHLRRSQVEGVDTKGRLDLLFAAGHPWDLECPPAARAGQWILPQAVQKVTSAGTTCRRRWTVLDAYEHRIVDTLDLDGRNAPARLPDALLTELAERPLAEGVEVVVQPRGAADAACTVCDADLARSVDPAVAVGVGQYHDHSAFRATYPDDCGKKNRS